MRKTETARPRPGIRSRVMLYLLIFVAFVILLLWLFQIVFLDDFYRAYKRQQVVSAADTMAANLDGDGLQDFAESLAARSDICIMLLDGDQSRLVSAEATRSCLLHSADETLLKRWCSQAAQRGEAITRLFGAEEDQPQAPPDADGLSERGGTPPPAPTGSAGGRNRDWQQRRNELAAQGRSTISLLYVRPVTLADGTAGTLLLCTQLTPVSSTVSALRAQLLVITLAVLLGAAALAALISRRVSTPIIETNEAARCLSHAVYEKPGHAGSYREIAELNDTLARAAEELGRVDALQHELVANVSHDLRTPLTMIGGYAEAMRDMPDERTSENMQIIIDETARLSSLVSELLDFSRLQAGAAEFTPERFCLTRCIQGIVGRIGSMTAKDGYRVLFEPGEDIDVLADERRVEQVVYNLIGNALTYTGPDKTVTVRQTIRGSRVRVEVTDSGEGIAPEELDSVWNRYYRTRETHRRAIIGSGLGLNIVRSILEHHRAPYGVDSQPGCGSTFWFELELC